MNLIPSYKLYSAAWSTFSKGIKKPRPEIGQMCHHMVLDLLERAGLVKMERVKGKFINVNDFQTLFQREDINKEKLTGIELTEAVNSQGLILFIDVPDLALGQHPAHSLVTMGNGEVAGYNNVGSLDPKQFDMFKNIIPDNNFRQFPLSCLSLKNKTMYGVSPQEFAQKI